MKLLPEDKKKTLRYTIILILTLAGIIYFNLFAGAPPAPSITRPGSVDESAPVGGGSSAKSGLLPFGGEIDTSLFDTPEFRRLRTPPSFGVSEEELGKTDLFAN